MKKQLIRIDLEISEVVYLKQICSTDNIMNDSYRMISICLERELPRSILPPTSINGVLKMILKMRGDLLNYNL